MKETLNKIAGFIFFIVGGVGVLGITFFYAAALFSNEWEILKDLHTTFRLLYDVPSGILMMYAAFFVIFIPLLALFLYGINLFFKKNYLSPRLLVFLGIVWIFAVIIGSSTTLKEVQNIIERIKPFSQDPVSFEVADEIPYDVRYVFRTTLKMEINEQLGQPIEGYEPSMFLYIFPGLTETDFEGVEASIGRYTMKDGKLVHELDDTKLVHSAASAVTDNGLDTLLSNVSIRLGIDLRAEGTLTAVMEALVGRVYEEEREDSEVVACRMDAKMCPDGSFVGRIGPSCEFAACSTLSPDPRTHVCTPQQKSAQACTMEYQPVCGLVEVQCIKAPCNPVPQTFGNGCSACAEGNVISYTEGACTI